MINDENALHAESGESTATTARHSLWVKELLGLLRTGELDDLHILRDKQYSFACHNVTKIQQLFYPLLTLGRGGFQASPVASRPEAGEHLMKDYHVLFPGPKALLLSRWPEASRDAETIPPCPANDN